MRRAGKADTGAITRFLEARAETSMFPLANLVHHGLCGGHPRAMRFWLDESGGAIAGIVGVTEAGMAMVQLPEERAGKLAPALSGIHLIGVLGPSGPVRALIAAAGLAALPRALDRDEPHFALDLGRLRMPGGHGRLIPLADAPRETMLRWMRDYQTVALNAPEREAAERAEAAYRHFVEADSHRVLVAPEGPLAMTGFNASLPAIVQIGGVYTPPELRGRGHARRAVALHLEEALRGGARRATLFAASASAASAYRALGFQQIGSFTLCLFDGPQVAP